MMAIADNPAEELALKWFDRLSEGDFDSLRNMLHPDATWTLKVTGIQGTGVHRGPKGIVDDFLAPIRLGVFKEGDPKMLIDTVLSKGSVVCVECRGVGRLKSGSDYHNNYCWLLEIKDGRVFAIREYMDSYYVSTMR